MKRKAEDTPLTKEHASSLKHEKTERRLVAATIYHAEGYAHIPRNAVQHPDTIDQWTLSHGMSKLLDSMAHRTNPRLVLDIISLGIGHTLTFPWVGRIRHIALQMHDVGVSVIDVSAVVHTLRSLHVGCLRNKQFSLRITNLHRCSLLTVLELSFEVSDARPRLIPVRWVDPEPAPLVDLRISPKITRLQLLGQVYIYSRRPIRCPVELAASSALVGFGAKCWNMASVKESAIRARCLFKLYTALLRVCKTSLSLDTAWHRLVFKGPIHDPSIIPVIAHRLCPSLYSFCVNQRSVS